MTNMKTDKQQYTAPELTIVQFRVERGFNTSGTPLEGFMQLFDVEYEERTQETWSEHSTWGSDGDNFF